MLYDDILAFTLSPFLDSLQITIITYRELTHYITIFIKDKIIAMIPQVMDIPVNNPIR